MLITPTETQRLMAAELIQALGQQRDPEMAVQAAYQMHQRSALLWYTDFPDGWNSVWQTFSSLADAQMQQAADLPDWASLRTVQKLEACLMQRFLWLKPYRPGLQRIADAPWKHLLLKMRQDFATLDMAWRLAGDQSVDYNFYTKRFFLGVVYVPTYRYWLKDASQELTQTRHFLYTSLGKLNHFLKKTASIVPLVKNA